MEDKVSVLLFTYNQEEFIREAVESVIYQTFKNWELIINDNGSSDGTRKILEEYSQDIRIKLLVSEENLPIQFQWNRSLNESSGKFISILFGDDFYLPDKLNLQVNSFKSLGKDWGVVHGPGFTLKQNTEDRHFSPSSEVNGTALKSILEGFDKGVFINVISPLIRKTCFEEYPLYEDLFTEGEAIYFKFALSYKYSYLSEPLVVMREHETNAGWHAKRNIEVLDACLKRLGEHSNFPKNSYRALNKVRVKTYMKGAWMNVRLSNSMDPAYVRNRLFKAYKLDYFQIFSFKNIFCFILTFVPKALLKRINSLINFLLKKEKQLYFDDRFIKE